MSQERVDNLFASESWSAVYTAFTNISLKAYDFDNIREALLVYIQQTYPDKYNDFIASSEFVAVLDLVAYLGHSLSYRLDMNTRENFMDLAERKESILRIAKTLGYNKTRPINAMGFMKISSVMTNQTVYDSNGISLANRVVRWNDANDTEWYENFITVINSSLDSNTKIQNPKATMKISNVDHSLYEIKENTSSKSVVYSFKANLAGKNRTLEAVRSGFGEQSIVEMMPDRSKNFTIINRNDNLGPASDRTGFFVFTKLGKLVSQNFDYNFKVSNRVQTIATNNISNSDVWIQKISSTGSVINEVVKIDNSTRETAIYNAIRYGTGDIVNVKTTIDNGIELHYPDGNFGNAAYGSYRVWFRVVDNENYTIDRNAVKDATITIPYVGDDGRTYQLTLTLNSTRDFGENYGAETMASVRRIAPRSYYAQDRMVNAQDYNVLPLSLGTNIVKKVKAINTTFSGKSRFFELDDVTGHHSNVTVNSTDGSMYLDDDHSTMKLRFNKDNGNSINFIRNEISKALKHGSLANIYYINNLNNSNVVINAQSNPTIFPLSGVPVQVSATDPKTIYLDIDDDGDTNPVNFMHPGDFIKIETNAGVYWTRIYGRSVYGGGLSNHRYTITDIIPEEYNVDNGWKIIEIVKGFRTRFEDFEILDIQQNGINEDVSSFYIKYVYDQDSYRWVWKTHSLDDDALVPGTDIYISLFYNPGIRTAEAEYTVKLYGKKVVFESAGDVKFYYNNVDKIVDIETNLAHQDRIKIDYYKPGEGVTSGGDTVERTVVLGYSDIYNLSQDGLIANFELQYKPWTGAPDNLNLIQSPEIGMTQPLDGTRFVLVSPNGEDYDEADSGINAAIPGGYQTVLGNRDNDEYTLPITLDISGIELTANPDPVTNEAPILDTTEFEVSGLLSVIAEDNNVANADSSMISLTSLDIENDGFKGVVSTDYFNAARNSKNFVFIDADLLPANQNINTIVIDDPNNPPSGVISDYITFKTDITSLTYQFQFDIATLPIRADNVYWKQFAYAEIEIESTRQLSMNTIVVKVDGVRINKNHLQLLETNIEDDTRYTYRIIFWTYDPGENSTIDVYDIYTSSSDINLSDFKVRAESLVNITRTTQFTIPEYSTISSYIYDNYINDSGYIDYSKVKLTTMDNKRNPYGIISAIGSGRQIIIQKLPDENNYKVSDYAVATNLPDNIDREYYVYHSDSGWYNNENIAIAYTENTDGSIVLTNTQGRIPAGTTLKLVDGISYTNNSLARYNWEHFADTDKRIDPSTSNIVDVYVLTTDYIRRVDEWKNSGFSGSIPKAPNNYELKKAMEAISGKEAISDHVSYVPVKFKPLFGSHADRENQTIFKVVKKSGTLYTDSEIKSSVSSVINDYFKLENWDFGDTFYFSELAAYIHTKLPEYISSVVITPKYANNQFTKLLSITSEPFEIFMSVTTSSDVKIIESITDLELLGE